MSTVSAIVTGPSMSGPGRAIFFHVKFVLITLLTCTPLTASTDADVAKDFVLPDLFDEEQVSLNDYRGKVVYVDFWASWCGPCRKSMPLYETLYQEIGNENFELLAINLDEDREDALRFLETHPVSYPVVADPSGETAQAWGLKAMPTSFLLDSSGRVVRTYPGFKTSHMEEIRRDIESLLAQR